MPSNGCMLPIAKAKKKNGNTDERFGQNERSLCSLHFVRQIHCYSTQKGACSVAAVVLMVGNNGGHYTGMLCISYLK